VRLLGEFDNIAFTDDLTSAPGKFATVPSFHPNVTVILIGDGSQVITGLQVEIV
jgi:hypothetical protein